MPELQEPVDNGSGTGNLIVKPTDVSLHRGYIFYIKVTADRVHLELGDSEQYLGPYDLRIGCYSESVEYSDDPAFVQHVPLFVGDSTYHVWNLDFPLANQTWCVVETSEIRDDQGNAWTAIEQIIPDDIQPW